MAADGDVTTAAAERLRTDPDAWDAFVASVPGGSFLQLTAWAEANASKGWRSRRVVADGSDGPIGAQLLIHRMRPGRWSRAYLPRGPVAITLDASSIAAFTEALRGIARATRIVRCTMDPALDPAGPGPELLRAAGWTPAGEIQTNRTQVIDLRRTADELWQGLHPKWRQAVRRAERAGLTVVEAGPEGLDELELAYRETARREGFPPVAAIRAVHAAFARRGAVRLLLGHLPDGRPAGAFLLLDHGDTTTSLYGVATADGRRAGVNHLLEWETIRRSHDLDRAWYDLWGTDDEGVGAFKRGFGGEERRYIGAWQLVTDRPAQVVVAGLGRARSALAGFRRALGPAPVPGPVALSGSPSAARPARPPRLPRS